MTFRARVLAGFLVVVLVPLLVFAAGSRRLVRERLVAQYDRRVELLVTMLEQDMAQQGRAVTERIEALAGLLAEDNRFRQGLFGNADARGYVLDDQGALRKHMAIFVNGAPVMDRRLLADAVPEDGTVDVIQALSGG